MKKRVLASLLSLALLFTLLPVSALAAEEPLDGDAPAAYAIAEVCVSEDGDEGECVVLSDEDDETSMDSVYGSENHIAMFALEQETPAEVAEVGGQKYSTLAEAVDKATEGQTVTLLEDIAESGIKVTQPITIDLANHEIDAGASRFAFWLDADAKICNGTITSLDYYLAKGEKAPNFPLLVNGYELTLENTTIEGGYYAVRTNAPGSVVNVIDSTIAASDVNGTRGLYVYKATVNVREQNGSSSISGYSEGIRVFPGSTLNVYDGEISAKNMGIVSFDTVNLYGGTITAPFGAVSAGGLTTVDGATINATSVGVYTQQGGDAEIKSGSIDSNTYGVWATNNADHVDDPSVITISGGTIHGENRAASVDGNCTYEYKDGADARVPYPAVINISGGTLTGSSTDPSQAPSGVVIFGKGAELNISGGEINGEAYAIVGNGSKDPGGNDNSGTVINISGGAINQEKNWSVAIYHPQDGTLNISGGTITGYTGVQLCSGEGVLANISGDVVITGTGEDKRADKKGDGSIPDGAAVSIVNRSYPGGTPKMTITGGYFKSEQSEAVLAYTWQDNAASEWSGAREYLSISGGYFTSDPSEYVVADMAAVASDKTGYLFTIGNKDENAIQEKPATKPSEVNTDALNITDKDQKKAVEESAETVSADAAISEAARVEKVADSVKESAAAEAKKKLNLTDETVIIYKQTYLEIKPTKYETETTGDQTTATLTMEITPMVQIVASTASKASDIKLESEDAAKQNAIVAVEAKPLSITTPSEITVTLPSVFAGQDVYVKHEASNGQTYFYQGKADSEGVLTFTSEHGFSPFTFSVTNDAVAQVGSIGYASFQEAVDAADDGDTVEVLKNEDLTATVSGSSRTIKVKNSTDSEITATFNDQALTVPVGETKEYTYTQPVSDDSGSSGASNITTKVTHNPDGSKTTTVTNNTTGTVTETTEYPDGSVTTVKTERSGKVTTTETDPDGDTLTTVQSAYGTVTRTLTDSEGHSPEGWLKHFSDWYYLEEDGELATNWLKDNGKWYYLDPETGKMATGWVKDNGKWYYCWPSGAMATGWVKDNGKWYYCWPSGAMATGWVKDNGKWYYCWPSGAMATGWVKDNGKWYYLSADGAMATGWVKDAGKWYYLSADGAMAYNTTVEGYELGADGAMIG